MTPDFAPPTISGAVAAGRLCGSQCGTGLRECLCQLTAKYIAALIIAGDPLVLRESSDLGIVLA
jgi:hypothetical protein